MSGYRLVPRAHAGLCRIVLYIEERFGAEVTDRVIDQLERAFQRLATHPHMGHHREDITGDEQVLFWSVGPTLIAYRHDTAGVEILLVERGERDWERMLEEE